MYAYYAAIRNGTGRDIMIKLLIVDDEPLVQIGIKSMLRWDELGIEVCGTAMNGKAALEMIRQYRPDIVITDIKMPVMNGLELVKICRDEFGPIPLFIILTSFEEFSLIKEAMSYQAIDYLIKLELDPGSLKSSIEKASERLEELKAKESFRQNQGRPTLLSYHDKFFMRLLHNLFENRDQFSIQSRDLGLDFSARQYLACHGELLSCVSESLDPEGQINLYSSSLQMMREILTKYAGCYAIALDKTRFALIFHFPDEQPEMETVLEALNNGRSMIRNYFNVELSAGIGEPVDDPLKISISYQEARQAFNLCSPDAPFVPFTQTASSSIRDSFNLAVFKEDLTRAFEEFDTDALYDTLTVISQLFAANPQKLLQTMDGACSILYLALSLLPEGEEILSGIFSASPDGYRSIYRMKDVFQIVRWLEQLRDGLCEALKTRRKTYKDHVILNVQKYILNHIEEHLSLNEIAAVFGLSPNYLSTLFKKTCSMGFSEYITQRKISRAKPLLLEQDLKIYEVADRLGFESAFYFSKVFKKVEGISPREFVQAHMNEPNTHTILEE